MTEYGTDDEMFSHAIEMMHRNPDLQMLSFDHNMDSDNTWDLMDLVCDRSQPQEPIFVWPKLKYLALQLFDEGLWKSAQQIDCLSRFLVSHSTIETLVLREAYLADHSVPLSLSSYPDSLPRLKVLLGSPQLIAGVLESTAACLSVTSIIDNSLLAYKDENNKAHYVSRIIAALEKVPMNQVRRLRLEVPQLSREVYAQFARIAPNVRFLEFLGPSSSKNTTPRCGNSNPSVSPRKVSNHQTSD